MRLNGHNTEGWTTWQMFCKQDFQNLIILLKFWDFHPVSINFVSGALENTSALDQIIAKEQWIITWIKDEQAL